MNMPESVKRLFYDVDLRTLEGDSHWKFIIERILEYGDIEDIKWMMRTFSREKIVETIKTSKNLSKRSANFWTMIYGIPVEEVYCLKMSYLKEKEKTWKY